MKTLEKYKNKYRIKSSRLQGYDYSENGMYFVTICTKEREHFFGKIKNYRMILNKTGEIVDQFWQEIFRYFPFIKLDTYQIMPNHIHGLIEIIKEIDNYVETRFTASQNLISKDAINRVSTKIRGGITGNDNPMLNLGSLSNVIKWYKGRCSFEIRQQPNPITFAWQSRFYDHIIRNEIELNKIREYIISNPEMWERDRNNIENLWM
jgi:REP element-mobilizing transposase RayT